MYTVLCINCAYARFYALNRIYHVLFIGEDVHVFLHASDHEYARIPIGREV